MKIHWSISIILFALLLTGCSTRKSITKNNNESIEEKYSLLFGVDKSQIQNKKLYSFIESWNGTTYEYGGKSKNGVDCSGITSILLKEVYGKELSGSSFNLFKQCQPVSKQELREGDLVFFKIESKEVSHVGVYLQNNRFYHATTKGGVMINNLDEEYYRKYFVGGGKTR